MAFKMSEFSGFKHTGDHPDRDDGHTEHVKRLKPKKGLKPKKVLKPKKGLEPKSK